MRLRVLSVALSLLMATGEFAAATEEAVDQDVSGGPFIDAIVNGKPIVDVRYRFEWKEQDNFAEDAYANTVRTRLGFETAEFYDFSILLEFENVTALDDDHYNSTTNGLLQFPVIADPKATEVNRAQITFTGVPKTEFVLGRQRINLANQRFIGAVDFRQNQQTFDAARVTAGPFANVRAEYIYIDRVHRVFGDDHPLGEFDSDSHVAALAVEGGEFGKLMVYGLLLDLKEAPALSSETWGARYENGAALGPDEEFEVGAVAEFATQGNYADNPFDYREYYLHGELTAGWRGLGVKAGIERLGGNGVIGFSTPLATLHKFQGFADVFLVTPADGIQDLYGAAGYAWDSAPFGTAVNLFAVYHDFRTERGSRYLGDEVDAGVAVAIRDHWTLEIKGAVFRGGATGPASRSLVWTSLRFQY